jgi:hypothetical protein
MEKPQGQCRDSHLAVRLIDGTDEEWLQLESTRTLDKGCLVSVKRADKLLALD